MLTSRPFFSAVIYTCAKDTERIWTWSRAESGLTHVECYIESRAVGFLLLLEYSKWREFCTVCKVIFILCGSYTQRAVSPTPHRADGYWDADDRRMYFNTSSSRLYVSDYPYSKEAVEFDPKLGVHETFEIVGRYIFVQKTDNGMVALYVSDRRGLFDKAHIPIPGGHERYVCPCICDSNCTLQSAYLICLILHNRVGVTVVLYVCVCVCVCVCACVRACVRARARTCVTINFTLQSVHLTQEDV